MEKHTRFVGAVFGGGRVKQVTIASSPGRKPDGQHLGCQPQFTSGRQLVRRGGLTEAGYTPLPLWHELFRKSLRSMVTSQVFVNPSS